MSDVPKATKGSPAIFVFVIILCMGAAGLGLMYYMGHRPKTGPSATGLTNKSSCKTTKDIPGWPDKVLAQYEDPSKTVTITDAASCATACETASPDIQAAMYLAPTNECACYKKWDSSSACYDDPPWSSDRVPTLFTKSTDIHCSSGTPLPKCADLPNKWQTASDAHRGFTDTKLQSQQDSDDKCSRWCQKQGGVFFNYESASKKCQCGSQSEVDSPDTGPWANCTVLEKGWKTGPAKPANACPSFLTYLSSCHTQAEIAGWPNNKLASYVQPLGTVSDNVTCATACEAASADVKAAMYDTTTRDCRCYKTWDNDESACSDPDSPFDDDSKISLWTKEYITQCSPTSHLPTCSSLGYCTNYCYSWSTAAGGYASQCRNRVNNCLGNTQPTFSTTTGCDSDKDCPCACVDTGTCVAECKPSILPYCGVKTSNCKHDYMAKYVGSYAVCSNDKDCNGKPTDCQCVSKT